MLQFLVSRRSNKSFSNCLPWKYFLFCKLSTLYPGYVLKGEVYHSMRGFREKERSVLVYVTLMKGITGFKELWTLSNLCQLLTTHSVNEEPNHATETWKKDFFPLFVYSFLPSALFVLFFFTFLASFRIFPSTFFHPHFPTRIHHPQVSGPRFTDTPLQPVNSEQCFDARIAGWLNL